MKIKHVIAVIVIVALVITILFGCNIRTVDDNTTQIPYNNRFKKISHCTIDSSTIITVYYDTETMVLYQLARGDGGKSMSPLYNPDGTLMIYSPESSN